jgi:hypothetical protein
MAGNIHRPALCVRYDIVTITLSMRSVSGRALATPDQAPMKNRTVMQQPSA